jgi:hypothetical protein
MILANIRTDGSDSAWFEFFHERRTVLVRYIHGPMGVQIRTQAEAEAAAFNALAQEPGTLVLTVR